MEPAPAAYRRTGPIVHTSPAARTIGHTIDEKNARQILRALAADGVIERVDADRAVYRPTVEPEQ